MRWRLLVLAALSVGCFAGGASSAPTTAVAQAPQMPARDTPPPRTGTSVVSGRVLADTGGPVRHATVRIVSPDLRDGRAVGTDADGRYQFPDLPGGSYLVSATKPGFVEVPADSSQPLIVGEAAKAQRDIVLTHACAIAGRVVDEFGDPAANAAILVLRRVFSGPRGFRVGARGSGIATTNDLGQYRVYGLEPGTYYVAANARELGGLSSGMFGGVEQMDRAGYAQTYYPGTANLASAAPVRVRLGQDVLNADFSLVMTRTARVSGTVMNSQGRVATSGMIDVRQIIAGAADMGNEIGYGLRPDGTFVMGGLAQGDYTVTARVSAVSGVDRVTTETGRVRVTVAGSDVPGLTIQMSRGATVSGQLVFENVPPVGAALKIVVQPVSTDPQSLSPLGQPPEVSADNAFTLTGLFGSLVFRLTGLPDGWALKSVTLDGRDVTDTPINLEGREQITGLQVVVSDRVTKLNGTVSDAQGQPADGADVLILPPESNRWSDGSRYVGQTTARKGNWSVTGLPPGDYYAVALDPAAQRAIANVDDTNPRNVLRKLATSFSLGEAEVKSLALRIVKLPEL